MPIANHELNDDTDIILGRRGGVFGNARYQAAIGRWALQYANEKNAAKKRDILCQAHSYMVGKGLRFLAPVRVGPKNDQFEYVLVTENYHAVQRIQRSLQEHARSLKSADRVSSINSVSTESPEVKEQGGKSTGGDDGTSSKSDAGSRLVPGNENRSGTPLPLLLESKSSAFTISDASFEDLLGGDLLRQMSGYQSTNADVPEPEQEEEHRQPTIAVSAVPRQARSWPEIHLRRHATDTVSLITECSTSPETTTRRSPPDEATGVRSSSLFLPNLTSNKGQRPPAPQGHSRLQNQENHQLHRLERLVLDMHAEMQSLRARVATKEGQLHAMEERVAMVEEELRRHQHEQEPQSSSTEVWSTVG